MTAVVAPRPLKYHYEVIAGLAFGRSSSGEHEEVRDLAETFAEQWHELGAIMRASRMEQTKRAGGIWPTACL